MQFARQRNIVASQIAGTNWGKGLDLETRRMVSDWGHRAGIDPAVELNVLGGNFYKNAYYYIRRQSELMADGIIEYAYAEHVEISAELQAMAVQIQNPEAAEWAKREMTARAQQRILFNIPAKAVSSVVWHVKVRGIPVEFAAAKWCGGGTRSKDPVGDEFPVETSETRAARRTMRLLAEWRPSDPTLKALVEPNDDDSINAAIGGALREGLLRARAEADAAMKKASIGTIRQLREGMAGPYDIDINTPVTAEPVNPHPTMRDRDGRAIEVIDAAPRKPIPERKGEAPTGPYDEEESDTRPSGEPEPEFQDDRHLI